MSTRVRLVVLVLGLGLLIGLASLTGVREWMTEERLRAAVTAAGWWGLALFFAIFTVGQLLQVPGVVFIFAARAAWGPMLGFAGAYAGAVISATLVFLLVRSVGGKALAEITWPPARRILAGLEQRPVLTIAALRAVMMLRPPLNYALALSPVKQSHHFIGSVLGLIVPVAVVVFLSEGALALVRSLS
ncbi:MAG: VTT domain-containing protein [Archangium sp.]|nr:VTT domain-containing protein [Archangium sp.]MDP3569305.1 VTT domain-containing protein [Archangium sp.]